MARQMPRALPEPGGPTPSHTTARQLGAWLRDYLQPPELPEHPRRLNLAARDTEADKIAETLTRPGERPHRAWDEREELQQARAGQEAR